MLPPDIRGLAQAARRAAFPVVMEDTHDTQAAQGGFSKGATGRRDHSAVDYIVDRVRRAIREGRLVPGQRLMQEELTQGLKVSRGPVREALRRLAADGVIELAFNRGARVRRLTHREVVALGEAREAVETMAAELAARRAAGSPRREELGILTGRLEQAAASEDAAAFTALNEDYHQLIFALADNDVLDDLNGRLHLQVHFIQHQFRDSYPADWMHQAQAEHRQITAAILAGDVIGAREAMRAHVSRIAATSAQMPPKFYEPI